MRSWTFLTAVALGVGIATAADRADFDGNGSVDFDDFFLFADAFGARQGEARFDARFDLDEDGGVDFDDFFLFAAGFGKGQGGEAFRVTGLGGGGAMYSPSASPHDRLLMFVSCDMGGFYRSEDGGRAWRMLDADQMRASTRCRPVFHPRDPNVVYTYGGDALKVSEDRGVTWRRLTASPPWREEVVELGIDPGAPDRMFAGTDQAAYVSLDGGRTWAACAGVTGAVRGFHVDATSPEARRVCFIGTSDGVFRSDDGGRTWAAKSTGLPWRDLRGFCGATDPATGLTALTCTIPSRAVDGRFAGGVFRSLNGGETWQSAMGGGINTRLGKVDEYGDGDIAQYYLTATAERTPSTVYVTNSGTGYWPPYHFTVYRTDDGGGTWRAVYQGDPRFSSPNVAVGWLVYETNWGYGGRHTPSGFNVSRGDVDRAMYTNLGEIHITEDGGGPGSRATPGGFRARARRGRGSAGPRWGWR